MNPFISLFKFHIGDKIVTPFTIKKTCVVVEGKAVANTWFPWWHFNFGGWKNWRFVFEKAMRKQVSEGWYILGRFFGHLVLIDASTEECWIKPRFDYPDTGRKDGKLYNIRFGWFYWAVAITKDDWYPNPRRYMPGFAKLPYASEALAARYYLHDAQVEA